MKFTFKGLELFGVIITTRKQLENMPIGIGLNDINNILKSFKMVKEE